MASLFEQLVDLIHTNLAEPTVEKAVFRVEQAKLGKERRVLWIPVDFSATETKRALMRSLSAADHVVSPEIWNVEAHITGTSFEDVEALRAKLLTTVRDTFGSDSTPNGGVWVTQDPDKAGVMLGGREKAVQRFLWAVSVIESRELTPIKHIETTPALDTGELEQELEVPFVQDAP